MPEPTLKLQADPEKKTPHAHLNSMIRDAGDLLEFALLEWPSVDSKAAIPDDTVVRPIQEALLHVESSPNEAYDKRDSFLKAYASLVQLVKPVTIRTLRSSSRHYGASEDDYTDSRNWSRRLWFYAFCCLMIAIGVPILLNKAPQAASLLGQREQLAQYLIPLAFGGLGACAGLLRSCHDYIAKRQFDSDRIPEYNNRFLMGIISGGIVYYLVTEGKAPGLGGLKQVGAGALAFFCGYFNDYVTKLMDRLGETILLPGARQTQASAEVTPGNPEPTMPQLIEELANSATDEEKQILHKLAEKLGSERPKS
ncbi:MAG: hypothetical protein V2B18_16330 [Pseudomonadota bacterium]